MRREKLGHVTTGLILRKKAARETERKDVA